MSASHFSETYTQARVRFKEAAEQVGADIMSYKVDARCDEDLAIDVAILGEEGAPTLITSSGVHGVEGFMGSAIQLAALQKI